MFLFFEVRRWCEEHHKQLDHNVLHKPEGVGGMQTHKHTHSLYISSLTRCSLLETTGVLNVTKRIMEVNWLVWCQNRSNESRVWGWTIRHTSTGFRGNAKTLLCSQTLANFKSKHALLNWKNDTGERSLHWSGAMMSNHIRDMLLITQWLITEHYCTAGTLRANAAKL